MKNKGYTAEDIARAEAAVRRLPAVSGCKISTGEGGDIVAVHVTTTSTRAPGLVARDVATCLHAEEGIQVDDNKISVAVLVTDDNGIRDEPIQELAVVEFSARVVVKGVHLSESQDSIHAEVELERAGVETFGSATSDNPCIARTRVLAEATLNAVVELLDDDIHLCLSDVVDIVVGDEPAVVVKVEFVQNRRKKSLAGCSLSTGNENQTIVFATLDAVNRVIGLLRSKGVIEYKIR